MNQGILAALRGDQDHRVGSFDILVEKSCTLLSGVELVSFNFGRSRLSHPPFHPRVVRRVMVEVFSILIFSENVPGCHSIDPGAIGSRVTVQIEVFSLYLTFVHFVGISRAQTLSGG